MTTRRSRSATRTGPRGGSGGGDGGPRAITLRSTAFTDHAPIPAEAVGDGPPLEWIDVPIDAAEFAMLSEDHDAGDAVHWLAAGIPGSATGIGSATTPTGRCGESLHLPAARARPGAAEGHVVAHGTLVGVVAR